MPFKSKCGSSTKLDNSSCQFWQVLDEVSISTKDPSIVNPHDQVECIIKMGYHWRRKLLNGKLFVKRPFPLGAKKKNRNTPNSLRPAWIERKEKNCEFSFPCLKLIQKPTALKVVEKEEQVKWHRKRHRFKKKEHKYNELKDRLNSTLIWNKLHNREIVSKQTINATMKGPFGSEINEDCFEGEPVTEWNRSQL